MQLNQTSIYRGLELLMDWYLPIGTKMPKVDALENLGNFFQNNLMEAMTTFAIAWETDDTEARLELINTLIWHMALCNTAIGNLLQHCVSSLNSYSGFLVHGKSYNLQKKLLLPLSWFWKVCYTKGNLNVVVIKKQYKLTNYLIHEQELQCRITDSLRPRHRESFPDDKFLRRARIW